MAVIGNIIGQCESERNIKTNLFVHSAYQSATVSCEFQFTFYQYYSSVKYVRTG